MTSSASITEAMDPSAVAAAIRARSNLKTGWKLLLQKEAHDREGTPARKENPSLPLRFGVPHGRCYFVCPASPFSFSAAAAWAAASRAVSTRYGEHET